MRLRDQTHHRQPGSGTVRCNDAYLKSTPGVPRAVGPHGAPTPLQNTLFQRRSAEWVAPRLPSTPHCSHRTSILPTPPHQPHLDSQSLRDSAHIPIIPINSPHTTSLPTKPPLSSTHPHNPHHAPISPTESHYLFCFSRQLCGPHSPHQTPCTPSNEVETERCLFQCSMYISSRRDWITYCLSLCKTLRRVCAVQDILVTAPQFASRLADKLHIVQTADGVGHLLTPRAHITLLERTRLVRLE